ncbi:ABC transporter permease [Rhizobium sp. ARZ01]|uniref:ABC transporter permease n=1 Tax=Rhizobium sp. ARZ01 TaxID=2769313 RepID=UPI00177B8A28|nr:ABC transporter permease [Rhizobium sp. ARZ01]MBD9375447.1 ABC transporter permease [Rhizobium sp. ARZ01]
MDEILLVSSLLAAGIRLAVPIAFASIGETISQRAGVINVGIEGIMLVGAFVAVWLTVISGNAWIGLFAAVVAGMVMAAIHAYFAVILKVEQIVAGIALLFFGLGISGYGFRLTIGAWGTAVPVPGFEQLNVLGMANVPVVGPILFGQHALVYVMVGLTVLIAWMLRATRLGLIIKGAGDYPNAIDAVGINVDRTRIICTVASGAFAAVGGAFLSTAHLWGFVEGMTAGRGFLAIACVVFGRWNPVLGVIIALIFGIADAAQIRLQSYFPGIPYQFFVIVPYLVAILSIAIGSRRARTPAALGVPFRKAV